MGGSVRTFYVLRQAKYCWPAFSEILTPTVLTMEPLLGSVEGELTFAAAIIGGLGPSFVAETTAPVYPNSLG
jgi:hypothetical protein